MERGEQVNDLVPCRSVRRLAQRGLEPGDDYARVGAGREEREVDERSRPRLSRRKGVEQFPEKLGCLVGTAGEQERERAFRAPHDSRLALFIRRQLRSTLPHACCVRVRASRRCARSCHGEGRSDLSVGPLGGERAMECPLFAVGTIGDRAVKSPAALIGEQRGRNLAEQRMIEHSRRRRFGQIDVGREVTRERLVRERAARRRGETAQPRSDRARERRWQRRLSADSGRACELERIERVSARDLVHPPQGRPGQSDVQSVGEQVVDGAEAEGADIDSLKLIPGLELGTGCRKQPYPASTTKPKAQRSGACHVDPLQIVYRKHGGLERLEQGLKGNADEPRLDRRPVVRQ